MATFTPQKIDLSQINGGQRYGYEGISPEAINRPIEASAYAQSVADNANAISQKALEEVRIAQGTGEGITGLVAYPVGSIYISTNDTSPAILFGGTWEKIENKFLLGTGTKLAEETGGKSTYSLRANIGPINSNTFSLGFIGAELTQLQNSISPSYSILSGSNLEFERWNLSTVVSEKDSLSIETEIIPPYFTVNIWKRIA